jgi:dTDP-4-dehydrorhamnose 3,5-epimerase
MRASEVTEEWLRTVAVTRIAPVNQATIAGVVTRRLTVHLDGRGDVTELWSQPWEGFTQPTHVYQSATDHGVVKCWHLHEIHTDQFAITRGKAQVTLFDVRPDSETFGHVNVFVTGALLPMAIRIPPRVLHGWKALSQPEIIVTNLQSHVYDPADEYKFPWDCVLAEVWEPKNG